MAKPVTAASAAHRQLLLREARRAIDRVRLLETKTDTEREVLYDILKRGRDEGLTLESLAEATMLTRARVHQLTQPVKHKPVPAALARAEPAALKGA